MIFGTSPRHRYWVSTDPEGLVCATLGVSLHIFCWSTTMQFLIIPWLGLGTLRGAAHAAAHTGLFNMSLVSHARAMLTDPGAVPPDAMPNARDRSEVAEAGGEKAAGRWCAKCRAFKPHRAYHDSTTRRCIVKLDHMCPWTNNAVGIRNHKFFLLFCVYTLFTCMHSVFLCGHWVAECAAVVEGTPADPRWAWDQAKGKGGAETQHSRRANGDDDRGEFAARRRLLEEGEMERYKAVTDDADGDDTAVLRLVRNYTNNRDDAGAESVEGASPGLLWSIFTLSDLLGPTKAVSQDENSAAAAVGATTASAPFVYAREPAFKAFPPAGNALGLPAGSCEGLGVCVVAIIMLQLLFGCFTLFMILGSWQTGH